MPIVITVLINFTVNFLLILVAGALRKTPPSLLKALLAAGIGAAHCALCLLARGFWHHSVWRVACIALMGVVAFHKDLWQIAALLVLCLGVDSLVGDHWLASGLCVFLLLLLQVKKDSRTVPVYLQYGEKQLKLTALRDTGNTLRDPVTGAGVMVIGPVAARTLTGLTAEQMQKPLESVGLLPGLRLIPYKAIGSSGFLLGMRIRNVQIGNRKGSFVVAFAPEGLDGNMGFEALVGGNV